VIGGTEFVGRHAVSLAATRGHEVTVFHRGKREPADLADVEHVHGDRDGGLDALAGRSWDAALDTCGYVPRVVRSSAAFLAPRVSHYTFVSSLSVLPDEAPPGANEDSPVHAPPYPQSEEITEESYGPLKVACELEVAAAFPGRSLVIRPGYIVGPNDPTDRFTYWVRRAAAGGEMLAPGPPDADVQVLDVRDLAAFMLDATESSTTGTFGVVGPSDRLTMERLLGVCVATGGAGTSLVWCDRSFCEALGDEAFELFPLWHPMFPGAHTYDASKAVAEGLRHRTIEETVRDTLEWDRGRPPLRAGLTEERELALLTQWRSRG